MLTISDRTKDLDQPHEVTVWTGFDYPGRAGKHSGFKYNWRHFTGIDYEARTRKRGIWRFVGENKIGWATDVSDELGNYDYLMLADVDYSQPDVREDVFHWGQWIAKELGPGLRGLRFDAIKHYSQRFLRGFVEHLDKTVGEEWFLVGEYWSSDLKALGPLIDVFRRRMSLFDVQLVYNFSASSKAKRCDLRKVFDRTLASSRYSDNAVTFVQNHDTQETQALEAVVEEWFVPLAYAMILLRKGFGYPCVFYGDLYGIQGPRPRKPAMGGKLARLILARKLYGYGVQRDYDDKADCIGWTREGSGQRKSSKWSGIAVVLNSGWTWNEKRMRVGKQHAGEVWTDIMAWAWGEVLIDSSHGEGLFPVGHRGVSVWVNQAAPGRRKIDELSFDDDIYGVEKEKARVEALLKSLENSPALARKLGSKD
jgi:alpha-amylase